MDLVISGFINNDWCIYWYFAKLRDVDPIKHQDPSYFLNVVTSRYKPQYYFWELLIFIRRVIIALVSVSEPNITITYLFIIIMGFFLFLQYLYNPFIIHEANRMEFILLMCFIFMVVIQLPLTGSGFSALH